MIKLAEFITGDKPKWCNPSEMNVMVILLVLADAHGKSSPKLSQVIRASGLSQVSSVRRSMQKLEANGWIEITHQEGIGLPNVYRVKLDKL